MFLAEDGEAGVRAVGWMMGTSERVQVLVPRTGPVVVEGDVHAWFRKIGQYALPPPIRLLWGLDIEDTIRLKLDDHVLPQRLLHEDLIRQQFPLKRDPRDADAQVRIGDLYVHPRSAVLGSSFESEPIVVLPIKWRTSLEFLRLLPGGGVGNGSDGIGSFNGSCATAQNFTLDGAASTDADTALPSFTRL